MNAPLAAPRTAFLRRPPRPAASLGSRVVVALAALLPLSACSEKSEDPPPAASIAWNLPQQRGVTPVPVAATPEVDHAMELLRAVVEKYARDPDNPWAVCHAILALGTEIELSNGQKAVDYLFSEYAREVEINGEALIGFPLQTRRTIVDPRTGVEKSADVMVEPHPEITIKALAERGAVPGRAVRVNGRPYTLGHLYRHCMLRSWVDEGGVSHSNWNNLAWGLEALATWAPRGLAWTAEGGRPMALDAYTRACLRNLRRETESLRAARKAGRPPADDDHGLDGYTCGGAHYVQGVGYALARGFGTDEDRAQFEEEIALLFWGYQLRLDFLQGVLDEHPKALGLVQQQRYKFIGHFVETTHKLAALRLFEPDEDQAALMKRSVRDLLELVAVLEKVQVFARLGELRSLNEQVYLDYVGDSAHALHGLELATGRLAVAY